MKHLLHDVAIIALLAVFAPAWAQAPSSPPSPTPSGNEASAPETSAPAAASEKSKAPLAAESADKEKTSANASDWVQPKRPHRVHHSHRYARPHSPAYGSPYYWDYRWMSPADHMANAFNSGMPYTSWGWGVAPYHDSYN